jgi:hypothetical protein
VPDNLHCFSVKNLSLLNVSLCFVCLLVVNGANVRERRRGAMFIYCNSWNYFVLFFFCHFLPLISIKYFIYY